MKLEFEKKKRSKELIERKRKKKFEKETKTILWRNRVEKIRLKKILEKKNKKKLKALKREKKKKEREEKKKTIAKRKELRKEARRRLIKAKWGLRTDTRKKKFFDIEEIEKKGGVTVPSYPWFGMGWIRELGKNSKK